MAALQFYATGSFQRVVGRNCGLAQSTVSHCINDVTQALVKCAPEWTTYPTNAATLRAIKVLTVNEESTCQPQGVQTINVHEAAGRRHQVARQLTRHNVNSCEAYL